MREAKTNGWCAIELHRLAGEIDLCRDESARELATELRALAAELERRGNDRDGWPGFLEIQYAALALLADADEDDEDEGEPTRVEVTIRIAVDAYLTGDGEEDDIAVREAAIATIEDVGLDRDHVEWAREDRVSTCGRCGAEYRGLDCDACPR